ncbi:tyrosine-protein kinase Etk/Wzc [Paraburkholderia tropica]|uniref:non-specific protein-tyrosine kinase n=1 Tax=Paraburkholderia tropica TaxID=92647 RepID=A0ABX5MUR5_9BURK|nr:polysaccharide biosynthesis tyrosine autokinase [Paraburkholderia tropica]PXX19286.1 tyrosine-protein kinase Etk/Wzc [Paraburkholderia tropica]PZW88309.1 tyrosine-protein kinase Etk/Wzc [Paraburkholderia tropica]
MKSESTLPTMLANAAAQDRSDDDVSLLMLWQNVLSHRRLFYGITAGVVALAVLYLLVAAPVYKADALIQVDEQQGSALGALSDVASALSLNKPIDGELDILTSRAVLEPAIDATQARTTVKVANRVPLLGRLYGRYYTPPDGIADAPLGLTGFAWGGERLVLSAFDAPRVLYGKKFRVRAQGGGRWTLEDRDGNLLARGALDQRVAFEAPTDFGPAPGFIEIRELHGRPGASFTLVESSLDDTIDVMRKRMTVQETTKGSSMIALSVKNSEPGLAAAFANAVARAYVALNIKHRAEQSRLSLEFLNRKLPAFREELAQSEDRLNAYRIRTKTIDIEEQTEALLTRAVDLTKQKTLIDLNLQATREQFRPGHPAVKTLEAQDSVLDGALRDVEKQVQALPSTQQDYLRLARDVAVDTQLYTALVANAQQLEVAEAGTTGNVSVIDFAARPDSAAWPKTPIVLAGGVFGGVFLAFLVVQALAALRDTLRDPLDVERVGQAPIFAVVPASTAESQAARGQRRGNKRQSAQPVALLASSSPGDPSVEALRSLRTTLRFSLLGKEGGSILFTGPTEGVGKTFVALNFAYVLALKGLRVLIVDADLRRAGARRYFSANTSYKGLANVLAGDAQLEDALVQTGFDGLDLLPAGSALPPNPGELLERPAFAAMLKEAATRYDYVIVDSPPVLPVSDAVTLAQVCDATFVVSRADTTSRHQLAETMKRLNQSGIRVTGQVFNGFRATRYGYGYGYRYQAQG